MKDKRPGRRQGEDVPCIEAITLQRPSKGETEEGGCGFTEERVKDENQGRREEEFKKGG